MKRTLIQSNRNEVLAVLGCNERAYLELAIDSSLFHTPAKSREFCIVDGIVFSLEALLMAQRSTRHLTVQ